MRRFRNVLAPMLVICSSCAGTLEPTAGPPGSTMGQGPAEPGSSSYAIEISTEAAPIAPPSGPITEAPPTWIGAAPSQAVILPKGGAPVWIGVWIGAPDTAPHKSRPPMSLGLVVDTSGSMSGAKIENARLAATSLLEGVAHGDVVSIDAFSDGVRALAPPTVIGPGTLGPLIEAVRGLEAMGGTNLFGGLRAGATHAASSPAHPLRRVIVISDGRANVGPSSPEELGQLAARGTEDGVQVSAIGVGLDYDERTLGELARRSSGRMYHLEEPSQLAAILDQEVRLLGATVATGAYLEISGGADVEIQGAEFAEARKEGGALRVKLGSLYAGQRREVLVRAKVGGAAGSEQALAKVRLVYQDRAASGRWSAQEVAVRGRLSADAKAAEASAEPRVQAMMARHDAAEAQRRAAAMLDAGKAVEAANELSKAEGVVNMAVRKTNDPAERARLTEQAARMSQSRQRYQKADTQDKKRGAALESYSYSFSDDGLAAPLPRPVPARPSR